MQEFILNRGQMQEREKIPIKKTMTHGEYKKILGGTGTGKF